MQSEDIEYFLDGVRYVGTMATPDGDDPRPAVLGCHEGPGLTDHARSRARRLADELGYVAFALDYWGDGKPLSGDDLMAKFGALMGDQATTRARALAGLNVLLAHPRADHTKVGAMGYCFGGTMALELGRGGADIHAIVGFHSGLGNATPASAANITGKVLVCIGARGVCDPYFQVPESSLLWKSWRDAISTTARANASVYVVSPSGVTGGIDLGDGLADNTGGGVFVRSNDFARDARMIWDEAGHYYLFQYTPSGPRRDLHTIDVSIKRSGLRVRARHARGD